MANTQSRRKLIGGLAVLAVALLAVIVMLIRAERKNIDEKERYYRLKWLANVGFVGDLYADTYGLFLNEGLRVTVRPGGPDLDAIRELQTEQAQFGVASADQVIRAIEKNADVVVIAQVYRKNPVRWIFRSDKLKIASPRDLVGKRVGVTVGDNDETIMKALLKKHGIDAATLSLVDVHFSYLPFTKKEVDLFPVYMNTQGIELKRQLARDKEEVGFFDPDAAGITFVANSVITTTRFLKSDRPKVQRFLRAVLRGWAEALDAKHEGRAIDAMLRYESAVAGESKDELVQRLREQIAVTRELVLPPQGTTLGQIDVEAWKRTAQILLDQGIITTPVSVSEHLDTKLLEELANGG